MAAAEALKKKIQELMGNRDNSIEKGDELEKELNEMKAHLLKADFEKKELERRFKLTGDELDNQNTVKSDLVKKCGSLQVDDERIKEDMDNQVNSISEMEELILAIDAKYQELELEYNATMEDINAL